MENENARDEIEIDIKGLMYALLDKLLIIILIGVIGAAAMFAYSRYCVKPTYVSTTKVYIISKQSGEEKLTTSDLAFATYLANDYQILLASDPVLQEVIDELGLKKTVSELSSMISVSLIEDTRIMEISVTSTIPEEAQEIANKVRDVANDKTKDVMEGIEAVNAIDEAKLPVSPSSPNVKKNTLLGFILGLGLAVIIFSIRFILDDTIKTSEDVEERLGISVLGSIPYTTEETINKKKKRKASKKSK